MLMMIPGCNNQNATSEESVSGAEKPILKAPSDPNADFLEFNIDGEKVHWPIKHMPGATRVGHSSYAATRYLIADGFTDPVRPGTFVQNSSSGISQVNLVYVTAEGNIYDSSLACSGAYVNLTLTRIGVDIVGTFHGTMHQIDALTGACLEAVAVTDGKLVLKAK